MKISDVIIDMHQGINTVADKVEYLDDGIPIIQSKNFTKGYLDLEDVRYLGENDEKKYIDKYNPHVGDILMANIGTIGKSYVISAEQRFLIAWNAFLIKPNAEKVKSEFLKFYFDYLASTHYFDGLLTGGTVKFINKKKIGDITIPDKSLAEQTDICGVLSKVESVIIQRHQELELLDDLIKARFVELFGDLKVTTTIARYIAELRGGKSLAGVEECKNKVLKTGAATFGWFDPEQYKYLPIDYEPLPEHKVETGDVIISRMNTPELVGGCSYVFEAPEDMYYPDRLWKVIPKVETNPIFLWQLLWDKEIRRQIKEKSGGTSGTMHNISKPKLLEIKCIDAPIELQNQFADFVKQVDKSKFVA